MRITLVAALVLLSSHATAAILNVEFSFTPFIGDLKARTVQHFPGRAHVYVNNVLFAEDSVPSQSVPVENEEAYSAVWVPTMNLGPVLRKGTNKVRIEFVPDDPATEYQAQFRWWSATDSRGRSASSVRAQGNTAEAGMDYTTASGRIVAEREFTADFAQDLPWHHYPPVAVITDADRKRIAALVAARADAFKPNFAAAYQMLQASPNVDVAEVRKMSCLEAAYAAGVRAAAVPASTLDYTTTGNQEVVVRSRAGPLYSFDRTAIGRIPGTDDMQLCAGIMLSILLPPRLAVVRSPSGWWQVVY